MDVKSEVPSSQCSELKERVSSLSAMCVQEAASLLSSRAASQDLQNQLQRYAVPSFLLESIVDALRLQDKLNRSTILPLLVPQLNHLNLRPASFHIGSASDTRSGAYWCPALHRNPAEDENEDTDEEEVQDFGDDVDQADEIKSRNGAAIGEDTVLRAFRNCRSLQSLNLSGLSNHAPSSGLFSEQVLNCLSHCGSKLAVLGLSHCHVAGDTVLGLVSRLPALTSLDLSYSSFLTCPSSRASETYCCQTLFAVVQSARRLTHLDVSGCVCDPNAILAGSVSSSCDARLERLVMNLCVRPARFHWSSELDVMELVRSGCESFASFHALEAVGCKQLSPTLLGAFLSRCPNLASIDLLGVTQVDDALVHLLVRTSGASLVAANLAECDVTDEALLSLCACRKLEELNLSWDENVTDVGLSALLHNCVAMRGMFVQCLSDISDASLLVMARVGSAAHLQQLDLSRCAITGGVVADVLRVSAELIHLKLSWLESVTDEHVQSILASCPLLQSLGLEGCKLLTDSTLTNVASVGGPDILYLDFTYSNQISAECIKWLLEARPRITVVDYYTTAHFGAQASRQYY